MLTVNLNKLALTEFTGKTNPRQHCRATFPLLGALGTRNSAAVYFELEPGDSLGRHTDSAEESLLILAGEVEVSVGGEEGRLSQGEIAVVPTMVPHDLRNVGNETAKVLGFFGGANNIMATFDEVWLPTNSKVVDTAQMAGQSTLIIRRHEAVQSDILGIQMRKPGFGPGLKRRWQHQSKPSPVAAAKPWRRILTARFIRHSAPRPGVGSSTASAGKSIRRVSPSRRASPEGRRVRGSASGRAVAASYSIRRGSFDQLISPQRALI